MCVCVWGGGGATTEESTGRVTYSDQGFLANLRNGGKFPLARHHRDLDCNCVASLSSLFLA